MLHCRTTLRGRHPKIWWNSATRNQRNLFAYWYMKMSQQSMILWRTVQICSLSAKVCIGSLLHSWFYKRTVVRLRRNYLFALWLGHRVQNGRRTFELFRNRTTIDCEYNIESILSPTFNLLKSLAVWTVISHGTFATCILLCGHVRSFMPHRHRLARLWRGAIRECDKGNKG